MVSTHIRALGLGAKLQTQSKETVKALRPVKQIYLHLLNAVMLFSVYTGCPRRNVPDFGRVFLILNIPIWPKHLYPMINFWFQLMHNNFISLSILLYMFRAPICPSSVRSTIHSQQLVQCQSEIKYTIYITIWLIYLFHIMCDCQLKYIYKLKAFKICILSYMIL